MQEVFDKITDRLLEARKKNKYELYDCRANIGIDQAEKIVNDVAAEYNNGWIPVTERLPKQHEASGNLYDQCTNTIAYREWMESDLVMVTVYDEENDEYYVSNGYYINGEWSNFSCDCNEKVVAWQPLPEVYKN